MTARPSQMTDAQFTAWLGGITEALSGPAELTETAPDAATQVSEDAPERPLHELSLDEFRDAARAAWDRQGQAFHSPTWSTRRPMTVSELIAGRYEDDGTA